jgi:ribosomal protein L32E
MGTSNYHMHGAEKGLNELCGMLKTAEADIKKSAGTSHVMVVHNKPNFKKKGNAWRKQKCKGKAKGETCKQIPPAPKVGPSANEECFHCKGKGHC